MIKTKTQLSKILDNIGEQKIKQGIYFKQIAMIIKDKAEEKTLKEWLKFARKLLNLDKNIK